MGCLDSSAKPVRVILNDHDPASASDCKYLSHLAANAGVVNDDDGPSLFGDGVSDALRNDIQCLRIHIDKYWPRSMDQKCIGRRYKGETRYDHFISRLEVKQECAHFQSVRARCREER